MSEHRRDNVVRVVWDRAIKARARFAALMYLAVTGLVLSLLGGVVVTGETRAPRAAPTAAPAVAANPPPPLLQLEAAPPEPSSPPPVAPAASPTPEPSATVEAPALPRRAVRPRATPTARPAAPSAAPPAPLRQAQVGITDEGIFPKVVSVMAGSTVTWINQGSEVHTATGAPSAPARLDSGGLAAGQSFSLALFDPGTYHYTSAPDCLGAAARSSFDCSGASIRVLPPVVPALIAAPSAVAAALLAPPSATVQVTDSGFVPDHVAVKAGGWITWINQGLAIHTATSTSPQFDTGGLAPHQSAQVRFDTPGVFTYNSAPDCLNGNRGASFACTTPFTITVSP